MFRLAVLVIAFAAPVSAQSFQSMQLATDLGTVIGSEAACHLTFDQTAIQSWIDGHVDPSDMGFPGTLNMMVEGTMYNLGSMSDSAMTAYCRAVERTARHYGFIR